MRATRSVAHPTLEITLEKCGPEDLEPMLDRLETLLHEDYFFRRKHFAAILARENATVWAVRIDLDFAAIAIVYNGSTLQNLYVHPEHRRQGVGAAVLAELNPAIVRAKGNMSQGNPVPFYAQQGYKAVGADPAKPHIVLMTKGESLAADVSEVRVSPPPPPVPVPDTAKKPISQAKLDQLARNRAKAKETRRAAKQQADYERLVTAGIDPERAKAIVLGVKPATFGPRPGDTDLGAAVTVGTLPD